MVRKNTKPMKVLTLSIKREFFNKILNGEKTHEYREVTEKNGKKYINYAINGKVVPFDYEGEVPEDAEVGISCVEYDALRLLTGSYSKKRPWLLVEVKKAEHQFACDANGEVVYWSSAQKPYPGPVLTYGEYGGEDEISQDDDGWSVQRIDYTLGEVLDKELYG